AGMTALRTFDTTWLLARPKRPMLGACRNRHPCRPSSHRPVRSGLQGSAVDAVGDVDLLAGNQAANVGKVTQDEERGDPGDHRYLPCVVVRERHGRGKGDRDE